MSFPFKANPDSDLPLWVQLAQRIAYLIDTGYYRPGDQLPSVRSLAADASINYNTVNKAYTSLASEGYIESIRRKGCFVCERMPEATRDHFSEVESLITDCVNSCIDLGLTIDDVRKAMDYVTINMKNKELHAGSKGNIIDLKDVGRTKMVN